jgi:hypothetical protein
MSLANQVRRGVKAIAEEIYGEAADEKERRKNERRVYWKFESGQFEDVVWKEGNELVTTLAKLRKHYRIEA